MRNLSGVNLESFQLLTGPAAGLYLVPSVKQNITTQAQRELSKQLAAMGFRFTQQRWRVYDVLRHKRDHPVAEEVFSRVKRTMPEISLATVYNCLSALVKSGVARQVAVERGAARFCPNMQAHWHFHCAACGGVFDMDYPEQVGAALALPIGFALDHYDLAAHGLCPDCSGKGKPRASAR